MQLTQSPAIAIKVKNSAIISYRIHTIRTAAPDAVEPFCGVQFHCAPGTALVVKNGAAIPYGKDIRWPVAPDGINDCAVD